ncbi:MAG: serine hydrolase domain-containing protein [bacterium]
MNRSVLPILLFLLVLRCACMPEYSTARIVFPGKEWSEATPETQGISSGKLQQAIDYLQQHSGSDGVRELVIVRNGYLIHKGNNIDKVHGVWSMTKSFTSTVLGLLIDDQKATLDTLAKDFLPGMNVNYPTLTLRHFTTMTSGYRAEDDEPKGSYTHGPSSEPFNPGIPLFTPPGSRYAYWDSAMNQFANVLTRIAGEPIEELFRRRIADPIGMNPEQWNWGDFGEIDGIMVNGGAGNNGKHMFVSAREAARFGLLYLNNGNWNGRQLIGKQWVEQAKSTHVPGTMPLGHEQSGIDGRGVYGFNWWTNGIKPDGDRNWKDAPAGTYSASGFNNNDLFIIPEWDMVIVRLGLDQGDHAISDEEYNEFLKLIAESLTAR